MIFQGSKPTLNAIFRVRITWKGIKFFLVPTKINPFQDKAKLVHFKMGSNVLMKASLRVNQACVVKIAYNSNIESCINSLMCLEMSDTHTLITSLQWLHNYITYISTASCWVLSSGCFSKGDNRETKFWSIIRFNYVATPNKKNSICTRLDPASQSNSPGARIANDF